MNHSKGEFANSSNLFSITNCRFAANCFRKLICPIVLLAWSNGQVSGQSTLLETNQHYDNSFFIDYSGRLQSVVLPRVSTGKPRYSIKSLLLSSSDYREALAITNAQEQKLEEFFSAITINIVKAEQDSFIDSVLTGRQAAMLQSFVNRDALISGRVDRVRSCHSLAWMSGNSMRTNDKLAKLVQEVLPQIRQAVEDEKASFAREIENILKEDQQKQLRKFSSVYQEDVDFVSWISGQDSASISWQLDNIGVREFEWKSDEMHAYILEINSVGEVIFPKSNSTDFPRLVELLAKKPRLSKMVALSVEQKQDIEAFFAAQNAKGEEWALSWPHLTVDGVELSKQEREEYNAAKKKRGKKREKETREFFNLILFPHQRDCLNNYRTFFGVVQNGIVHELTQGNLYHELGISNSQVESLQKVAEQYRKSIKALSIETEREIIDELNECNPMNNDDSQIGMPEFVKLGRGELIIRTIAQILD